jgi:hypothetical protein
VPVAIGQAVEYKLLEPSPGDWDLAFQKKNGRWLGGPEIKKTNFSLSARVLQRKLIRQPAQK